MQRDTVVGLGPARARTRSPLTSVRRVLREREEERAREGSTDGLSLSRQASERAFVSTAR